MKLIFVFVLNLLLFNSCLSTIANSTSVGSQEILKQNGKNKTSLVDLNNDVLFLIFMEMDLLEWSNLAEVHSLFASIANDAFRQRYHNYVVRIYGTDMDDDAYKPQRKEFENYANSDWAPEWLILNDYKLVLNVFKYFSSNIQKLKITDGISVSIDRNRLKVVNQFVNRYASNYIKNLEIVIVEDTLEQFTLPFNNVEELKCQVSGKQLSDKVLPFNQMFPNIRKLNLEFCSTMGYTMIDCEFPRLEDVKIHLLHGSRYDDQQKLIRGFLEKNPQIKGLDIYEFTWEYVKYFSQLLPNLENVALNLYQFGDNIIQFESVKNAYFGFNVREYATKLSFPRLESLKFRYASEFLNEYRRFFNNHQTLKKLHVLEYYSSAFKQLVSLTENISNLVEIKLSCDKLVNGEIIKRFIQGHSNLKKITFDTGVSNIYQESEAKALQKQFENEWHITISSEYFFTFDRKNSSLLE